eukprot:5052492-Prymnesium_polylepis.1
MVREKVTWRLAVAFQLSGPGVGYLQYAKYAKVKRRQQQASIPCRETGGRPSTMRTNSGRELARYDP